LLFLVISPEYEIALDLLNRQATDWQARLASRLSRDEVLVLVREFIAARPSHTWARLPPECQPGPMQRPDEVSGYALALVRRDFALQGEAIADHYELAAFFTAAANRLAQLASTPVPRRRFF
jgi:hypothetical protein